MFNFWKSKKEKLGLQLPDNGIDFYSPYDVRLNPPHYLWAKYGCSVSSVRDTRNYDSEALVAFLVKNEGFLLDATVQINKDGTTTPQKDDLDGPPHWSDVTNTDQTWLFRDNAIKLSFESEGLRITTYYPTGTKCVHDELVKFVKKQEKTARVGLLLSRNGGLCIESIDCAPPIIDDMDLYYGEGFGKTFEKIRDILNSKRNGLCCLHSEPGTGKTTLIKYLTSIIDREFIFIPVSMIGRLSDPDFLSLLLYHKGAVLVLEDAEQALQSREKENFNSSVVATLLNLSDGLLGTLLNVTIIATYNAEKQFIDKALLRKGRLLIDHTFRRLTVEESKKLAKHLKKNLAVDKNTSIADIFNCEDDTGYLEPEHEKDKVIGFGALMSRGAK